MPCSILPMSVDCHDDDDASHAELLRYRGGTCHCQGHWQHPQHGKLQIVRYGATTAVYLQAIGSQWFTMPGSVQASLDHAIGRGKSKEAVDALPEGEMDPDVLDDLTEGGSLNWAAASLALLRR